MNSKVLQRLLLLTLFLILLILSYEIVKYFIVPVLWATIIGYVTWPIFLRVKRLCGNNNTLGATLMTLLVVVVIGGPITIGIFILQSEARYLYVELQQQLVSGDFQIPEIIKNIPFLGQQLQTMLHEFNTNPVQATQVISQWLQSHLGFSRLVFNEIMRNVAKFSLCIMSLFFFYRDGQNILNQVKLGLHQVVGSNVQHYFQTMSQTTRAVTYGVGLTAIAQGLIAGIGYVVAGVPNPMVLTLVTCLFALFPFGTPFAWGSVTIWLATQDQNIAAIGMLLWGLLVVSTSDNVIRPLVISGATKIHFLLIMFGVLGGLASFGLVGIFIGPVVLAVMLACWHEWLKDVPSAIVGHHDDQDFDITIDHSLKNTEETSSSEKSVLQNRP